MDHLAWTLQWFEPKVIIGGFFTLLGIVITGVFAVKAAKASAQAKAATTSQVSDGNGGTVSQSVAEGVQQLARSTDTSFKLVLSTLDDHGSRLDAQRGDLDAVKTEQIRVKQELVAANHDLAESIQAGQEEVKAMVKGNREVVSKQYSELAKDLKRCQGEHGFAEGEGDST